MAATEKLTQDQVIEALTRTKGMVFLAAKQLGCTYTTVYNYIRRYPAVAAAKELSEGQILDTAEIKLFEAVLNGEAWALSFVLKTKAKLRGYTERHDSSDGLTEIIKTAVQAAEQAGLNAEAAGVPITGADKKAMAVNIVKKWATKNKIALDATELSDRIEAMVFQELNTYAK